MMIPEADLQLCMPEAKPALDTPGRFAEAVCITVTFNLFAACMFTQIRKQTLTRNKRRLIMAASQLDKDLHHENNWKKCPVRNSFAQHAC